MLFRSLYILEINPLAVDLFANIFSHSVVCIFILAMVSFAGQKLLNLIRSHLLFLLLFLLLRRWSQKSIATIYVKECSTYIFF